ncbi:divisome protein SepX/GlpR [Nocardia sp. NPDC004722]
MPNSILWIGLVVLWVFVLFPMLANRHPRIRQHTDAALSTRVLHRGGAERSARKGPATGHDTDPDYVPVRRKLQHPSEDPEDRMTRSDDSVAASDEKEVDTEAPATTEAAEPEADSAETATAPEGTATELEGTAAAPEETGNSESETGEPEPVAAETPEPEPRTPQRTRIPALRAPDPAPEPEPESDSDDEDFVPSRRGRGGFDAEADAAARAARYTFRQRAVLGLVLSTLILAAAGFAIASLLWALCALSAVVLVGYLGYLRRQVRIEADIRRRRAARAVRKRTEVENETPARDRPRPDREQTRTQLRRAVLVEPDDEDPLFEHLELFDAAEARATRQRATGGRERRAVGE